jgi:hypothetical protein
MVEGQSVEARDVIISVWACLRLIRVTDSRNELGKDGQPHVGWHEYYHFPHDLRNLGETRAL